MKRTAFAPRATLRHDQAAAKAQATPPLCEVCEKPFFKRTTLHTVCSERCSIKLPKVRAKAERKADKAKLDALQPRSYWEKMAEAQVNRYCRLRDAKLGCISCEKPATWDGQWHASHFRSVGAASAIRYHLWNISKACSQCNKWLSGNIAEYEPRLRARRGDERVDWLKAQNQIVRYEIDYLKRLKSVFSRKANRLAKRLEGA